jgi:RNA polymerase sigma-70 factor (ECF subfamily)
MLEALPAADDPDTVEFDHELRRAVFHRAAEQVQGEVRPTTWRAFWETSINGTSAEEAGRRLGMTPGAVRVANCRVLARMRAAVAEMEENT